MKSGLGVKDCDACRISSTFLDGVNQAAVGNIRKYANFNVKVLTYILPYIVDPAYGSQVDAKAASQGITADENEFFQAELAT